MRLWPVFFSLAAIPPSLWTSTNQPPTGPFEWICSSSSSYLFFVCARSLHIPYRADFLFCSFVFVFFDLASCFLCQERSHCEFLHALDSIREVCELRIWYKKNTLASMCHAWAPKNIRVDYSESEILHTCINAHTYTRTWSVQ
jgi:hypothetical protein